MKRLICVLAVLSAAFACNENPETPTDEKIPEPDVPGVTVPAAEDGSLDFEIFNDNGGDGLLPEEPAVATVSEPLAMSIIQSSSYTDPDGTVYECEPKAEIVLRASVDTVFVKDIRSLINVSDDADVKTSKEGENPVKHLTKQSFDIGGQTVEFDLSYEVYTYVNSQKQNIEMPYIKLNNADFGSAESVDVKSSVKLSDISIRPLKPAVRSIEVTDSTEYEVTARFNLDAETANLASTTAKTISFEVVYVGVVTQTSTYPGAEYSYNLTDAEGNPVENADFTIKPNSSFELNINQNSSYTDQNGAVTATPKAWTRIVTPDTLRIDKAEDLVEKLSEVSIETHSDELEGNLPYYKLGEVALDGEVAVAEVYKSEDGKLEVYKATATYKQKASPVNIDGGEELEFTYVVEYAGKVMFSGAEFSYEITDAEGNSVENADFTIKPNSSFELNINQNSSYTDRNGVVTATPKAWTRIVTPDTLRIEKSEDLVEKLSEVSIETHSDELEGNLPYYKIGEVALDGEVAVAEVSSDGNTIVYKATATYKQKATPVNIDGEKELQFTYVVSFLGKVEVTLVNVEYEQEVIWEDAHDNIKTNSQIVVTRRAKYSDGTVEETKFYSTKNFVQSVVSGDKKDSSGEIEYTYYPMEKTANTFVSPYATGVPDLEHLSYKHRYADSSYVYLGGYEGPEGNWTEYKHMYTNELYDESVQTEGMYGKQFGFRSIDLYSYVGEMKYILRDYKIDLIYKDRFFCIDGRLFTFDPLEHTHRYSIDTIMTANRGKCVLVKNEADVTWLGRDFYYAVVDTVYVKQPSAASSQSASSASSQSVSLASRTASAARPSRPARESRSGSPYVTAPEYQLDDRSGMSLSVETVPGSVPYTVRTVIRPDGTVTTRRYEGIVSDLPLH